jgi:heme exporter protein D
MADIPALLAKIPDEFKPLAAFGVAALMLIFIVLLHGAGLHFMLVQRQRHERRIRRGRPYILAVLLLFAWSVFFMLALHITEFVIWAYALIYMGLIPRSNDAIYFCANAYTTLGYGNVDLGAHWRNISPIVGISGLFTMAWTTSALVGVVSSHRQLLEQIEDEREREIKMRIAMSKEEWKALETERNEERAEEEKTRMQVSGKSFFQRRQAWREERKKAGDLRRAMRANIEEVRGKERQEEANLGAEASAANSADNEHQ